MICRSSYCYQQLRGSLTDKLSWFSETVAGHCSDGSQLVSLKAAAAVEEGAEGLQGRVPGAWLR